MQSTVNYLWHTDDLLGQGATASVYKARNKVGCSPAHPGPLTARKSAPSGHEGWCAGFSDCVLHPLKWSRGVGN